MNAQKLDSSYFLSPQISFGPSFAPGAYTETENSLGKNLIGFCLRLDIEKFIKRKYSVSCGLEFNTLFFKDNNINKYIKKNRNVVYPNSHVDDFYAISPSGLSIGLSRPFQFHNFIVEPKIYVSAGFAFCSYSEYYTVRDTSFNYDFDYHYTGKGSGYALITPKLDFKYIFLKKRRLDLAFHAGISYSYYNLAITIKEEKKDPFESSLFGGNKTEVLSLSDKVGLLNVQAGISFFIKKRYR